MKSKALISAALALAPACGGSAKLPLEAGIGPNPELPPPRKSLIPVVRVAKAEGWATVAESNAPPRPKEKGIRGWFMRRFFHQAGADVPSREVLTGFLTSDGHAQGRPVGMAIDRNGALLVADDVGNAVWRVVAK